MEAPAKSAPAVLLSARVSPEVVAWLEATAREQDRSVSYVVARLLAECRVRSDTTCTSGNASGA